MNLKRVFILLRKELLLGPKNFMVIMALVVPLVLTLVVSLVFGTYFSGRSRLGVVDAGSSQLARLLQSNQALAVRTFASAAELEDAVRRGALDIGLALPADFDRQVQSGETAGLTVYVWGESLMQNRIIVTMALIQGVREIAGHELPVQIEEAVLGSGVNVPWEKRLLPFMVLMTVILGGAMVPATSLVMEKVKRTLPALGVSPATLMDVLVAKGLMGVLISLTGGLLILFLNRAFGGSPLLLVFVLTLGAIFSAAVGMIFGALVRDMNTLMTVVKSTGILLYAPAFVYMFPELPQWIGRLFPTYYIIDPVLEITQNNAGLADIALELVILVGLIVLTLVVAAQLAARMQATEAAA